MLRIFFFLFFSSSIFFCEAQKNYLLVGTYTTGKSEGMYVYDWDSVAGNVVKVSSIKTDNPSFLTVVNNKYVYAVNQNDSGAISSFQFNNGTLTLINTVSALGKSPCHISYSNWYDSFPVIITGNYSSGNFVLYNTNATGALTNLLQSVQHYGSSINVKRQTSPHVHNIVVNSIANNRQYLYVSDLGTDKVMVYKFNKFTGGVKSKGKAVSSIAGSGPRHLTFSPNKLYAYLIEELTGTVVAYKVKHNGTLKKRQRISSHPLNYTGAIGSADIHVSPNGKFLYVSNRGDAHNIAIFSIHTKTGKLTPIGFSSTLGKNPRNFNFSPDGKFLLVANQASDAIVVFRIDAITGLLTDTGNRIAVHNPVCLQWIEH